MLPRGIRNCNPLNIRRSKDQWKGLLPEQNDKSFYQFKAMDVPTSLEGRKSRKGISWRLSLNCWQLP